MRTARAVLVVLGCAVAWMGACGFPTSGISGTGAGPQGGAGTNTTGTTATSGTTTATSGTTTATSSSSGGGGTTTGSTGGGGATSTSSTSSTSSTTTTTTTSTSSSGCGMGMKACNGSGCQPTDVNHGCDNPSSCTACPGGANADPACDTNGQCTLQCHAGFGDCDNNPSNGCETDTNTTIADCGSCGRACSSANVASQSCAGGVCNSTCVLGYANCNMPATGDDDGCEVQATGDASNCGGCQNSCKSSSLGEDQGCHQVNITMGQEYVCGCSDTNQCAWGNNTSPSCNNGFCKCNNTTCNQGEACKHMGSNDVCTCRGAAACPSGQVCCDKPAGCFDLTSDVNNCGACGRACPPSFTCYQGGCYCAGNDAACNGGAPSGYSCPQMGPGAPFCHCNGATCTIGQRCLPDGSCG